MAAKDIIVRDLLPYSSTQAQDFILRALREKRPNFDMDEIPVGSGRGEEEGALRLESTLQLETRAVEENFALPEGYNISVAKCERDCREFISHALEGDEKVGAYLESCTWNRAKCTNPSSTVRSTTANVMILGIRCA